jgi:hypothetical protein
MARIKKPHQQYFNSQGILLPGVTTVLKELDQGKSANLINWAWKLGKDGIDYKTVRDNLAGVGTLAHQIITDKIQGNVTDMEGWTPADIDLAENCCLSFWEWEKQNNPEYIFCENQMVSEQYQFGGTCDIYCKINGVFTLIDLKTGKAIYSDMSTQLSAYKQLIEGSGYPVEDCRIIRIGRDENEGFEDKPYFDLTDDFTIFRCALTVYNIRYRNGLMVDELMGEIL